VQREQCQEGRDDIGQQEEEVEAQEKQMFAVIDFHFYVNTYKLN